MTSIKRVFEVDASGTEVASRTAADVLSLAEVRALWVLGVLGVGCRGTPAVPAPVRAAAPPAGAPPLPGQRNRPAPTWPPARACTRVLPPQATWTLGNEDLSADTEPALAAVPTAVFSAPFKAADAIPACSSAATFTPSSARLFEFKVVAGCQTGGCWVGRHGGCRGPKRDASPLTPPPAGSARLRAGVPVPQRHQPYLPLLG